MPLPPQAPYDTLATLTQMVRTLLGDFIQNLQPNQSGVVTVGGGGFTITWTSGNQFTALFNNLPIVINGVANQIQQVTSPTTATLLNQAALGAGQAYTLVIPTGEIFNDAQSYVLPTVILAWRMLQKKLADKGHPRLEVTTILNSLPVIANLDPGIEQFINWAQFYDGANTWTPAQPPPNNICPVLPPDFISPLHLEERQSVVGATAQNPNLNVFRDMRPAPNGLRSRVKGSWNRYFDWRGDAIYFRGSILLMDVKIRYAAFLADIAVAAGGFSATPIPIMRSIDALAAYCAGIFVTPRGGELLAPGFFTAGDAGLAQITNSYAKLQQRASYSRRAWGSRRNRAGRRNPRY